MFGLIIIIIINFLLVLGYYHQVKSYGSSNVAVSILFSRFDDVEEIDLHGCDKPLSYTPLSDLDVDWKYPGHGNLSMGNTDLEGIRYRIYQYFVKPFSAISSVQIEFFN